MQIFDDVTMLAAAPAGGGLVVEWEAAPPPLPTDAAAYVDARWAEYVAAATAAGHALFNGPITRLLSVATRREDLVLRVGPGDYKTFLVTVLRDRAWFEMHAREAMVAALGNSALVTRGDYALLAERSAAVSCYAGRVHTIGGVVEALATPGFPASRAGIEAHLLKELQEEVGLRRGEERRDGWPKPIGVARDHFLQQPELFWQWEVAVPLEELRARLNPEEHSAAFIVGKGEMTAGLWEKLTPVARLAWHLWTAG
jgi:8-oxo-dGTP pyrophosphatase MutT (NUDIX family)